jgi:hypothetical protein
MIVVVIEMVVTVKTVMVEKILEKMMIIVM